MIKKQRRIDPLQISDFELYGTKYEVYVDYKGKHLFVLWDDDVDEYNAEEDLMQVLHLWVYEDEDYEDDEDYDLPDNIDMIHHSHADGYVCKIVGVDDV